MITTTGRIEAIEMSDEQLREREFGLVYNGPQERPKGQSSVHLWTCLQTYGTFATATTEYRDVEVCTAIHRHKFNVKPGMRQTWKECAQLFGTLTAVCAVVVWMFYLVVVK